MTKNKNSVIQVIFFSFYLYYVNYIYYINYIDLTHYIVSANYANNIYFYFFYQ